eukprot:707809_1
MASVSFRAPETPYIVHSIGRTLISPARPIQQLLAPGVEPGRDGLVVFCSAIRAYAKSPIDENLLQIDVLLKKFLGETGSECVATVRGLDIWTDAPKALSSLSFLLESWAKSPSINRNAEPPGAVVTCVAFLKSLCEITQFRKILAQPDFLDSLSGFIMKYDDPLSLVILEVLNCLTVRYRCDFPSRSTISFLDFLVNKIMSNECADRIEL